MNCWLNQVCFSGYTKLPFKWFDYLRETGSIAAPVKLFNKVNLNNGIIITWNFFDALQMQIIVDQNVFALEFLNGD